MHMYLVEMANNYKFRYELVPHPPYSSDSVFCDLFSNLKKWLGGKKFVYKEEVTETMAYFKSFEKSYYLDGIKLENPWTKFIGKEILTNSKFSFAEKKCYLV